MGHRGYFRQTSPAFGTKAIFKRSLFNRLQTPIVQACLCGAGQDGGRIALARKMQSPSR